MTFTVPQHAKFAVVGSHRKAASYCEGCRKVKPRTGKVYKGWRCVECRQAEAGRFSPLDVKGSQVQS